MDPITHTLTGAAIAAGAGRRRTALAAPVAIIGANAPDIDVAAYVNGEYAALALRRGWTHGPIALVALAIIIPLLALAYDRLHRARRVRAGTAPASAADPPARAAPLFVIAALAVLSHPLLDWMNTYGIRWLMPFDRGWYYGDSLFIIDPWIWLALGVPLFLLHSTRPAALVGWAVGAALATVLVLTADGVPAAARAFWLLVLAAAVTARLRRPAAAWEVQTRAVALAGIVAAGIYIATMVAAAGAASRLVAAHAADAGIPADRIMVGPRPADPLRGDIVIAAAGVYHHGRFDWRASPRVRLESVRAAGSLDAAPAVAAAAVPDARDFLRWSRFPVVDIAADGDGYLVRFGDARYGGDRSMGALGGIAVRLDAQLRPR